MTQKTPIAIHLSAAENLGKYMQAVNAAPILSAQRERELALRYRNNDDLDAARELIMSHLRYVVKVARGFVGYGLPLPDLIQEGSIGLMKAVKRYDPNRDVRLVSFAVHWIKAEIYDYVLRNWRMVKVATTKAQRKLEGCRSGAHGARFERGKKQRAPNGSAPERPRHRLRCAGRPRR